MRYVYAGLLGLALLLSGAATVKSFLCPPTCGCGCQDGAACDCGE